MKIFSKSKGILFFYAFDILLLIIFAVSFIPFAKNRRVVVNSAALNPKYISDISKIVIEIPEMEKVNTVTLNKSGSIWTGIDSKTNTVWPCDETSVNNLLALVSKTVKMYKKSDKKESWETLGVDESNARKISFITNDGNIVSALYYGVEDGILKRISVRSREQTIVYDTENSVATYLTSEASFWADPFIYPEALTDLSRAQSQEFLRRGQIIKFEPETDRKPDYVYTKIFENEADITLSFFNNGNNTYSVLTKMNPSPFVKEEEEYALSKINYSFSVSSWTFDKLLEN